MPLVRGATLFDLITELPPGAQGFIPESVNQFINLLNIAELQSRSSGRYFLHSGRVQSASEAGLALGANFPVEIPGLNVGVPFQLAWVRATVGTAATDLEGEPTGWILDLFLERVAVVVPIGQAARLVPTAAVAPAHLEAAGGGRVKLYARGVLRIEGGAGGSRVRVIADPDPFVPDAAIGAVIETGFSPPHLLLHESGFGLTVNRVVLDLSDAFTPADIVARGHGADFEGMTITEATLYFPRNLPFVGDVNIGVRDLLIGWSPTPAFQGEARVELGLALESAAAVAFFQDVNGVLVPLGGPSGSGTALTVTLHPDTGPRARLFARMTTPGVEPSWTLPAGGSVTGVDTGWFEVGMPSGSPLRATERRTGADGEITDGQERSFIFVRAAASTKPEHAPPIRVKYSNTGFSHAWDDVASLRGPGTALDFVAFEAVTTGLSTEDIAGLRWQWEKEGSSQSGSGESFAPDVGWSMGRHTITLKDRHNHVRRCVIESSATTGDTLFVGHRGGGARQVTGATDVAATLAAVENSWDLAAFHASDGRSGARSAATLAGATLTVPKGALAEVTVAVGTPAEPEAPVVPAAEPPFRHVRVRMTFNQTDPTGWRKIRPVSTRPYGPAEPYPTFAGGLPLVNTPEEQLDPSFTTAKLGEWASGLPADTRFVVVGRCCDLGTLSRNIELADARAKIGRDLLVTAGISADRIRFVGEQGTTKDPDAGFTTALQFPTAPQPVSDTDLEPRIHEEWAFKAYHSATTRTAWGDTQDQPERKEGRGVDIYAMVPAAAPVETATPTDAATRATSLVRLLVPGENIDVVEPFEAKGLRTPYRVEVKAKWDSPSIVEAADWVPTMAQVTVEWASSAVPVPGLADPVTPTRPSGTPSPTDLWRVIGRFSTDLRSGQTSYLLSLDSMGDADGLFAIVSPGAGRADETVAVGLALAPALLGGITTDDPAGAAVRIGALIAASAAAAALQLDGQHVINDGRVIVEKLEGEVKLRAIDATDGMKIRIGVDYTASFGVKANVAGAVGVSTISPIKVKYKNVGLEYEHDTAKPLLERIRFVFEDAKFEVADPGRWAITGALGRLLGITAIRVGAGSVWIEVDVEFALDLGVVEISRTTIRVEIHTESTPPTLSVSIRGIKAKIDVPGTIKGKGELRVLPDGFGASLELDILPAKLKAWGGFVVRPPMVHIEGGVRFATGIPLGSTGLGLFGFAGRFVANGQRNLSGLDATDIIAREVGWHDRALVDKYNPQQGQFAIGFGVYVGTLPDAGFTFNALGMLTVAFPDVSVVLAIDATLLSAEPKSATETKAAGTDAGLQLLGIVSVDPTAIGIAIRGKYTIPKVLILEVPIGAYFPLQSSAVGAYVRVGSDGAGGRPDRPVTVRILPDLLDLRATAFFMVEERKLHDLGGKPQLDFDGFSIGFGAGLSVKWGGGPIYLRASFSLLVGLGTRPFTLAGGIYVQGELRLIIISISVTGELEARITDKGAMLRGEFCGEVDFFFFSVEGCVSFTVGSEPAIDPPPADPLVSGLVLADKFSRVVGEGAASLGALTDAHTAWPDAAPVLRFSHGVRNGLGASGYKPTPSNGWGAAWSGTNRVRYLYELQAVELFKHPASGPALAIDTTTWPSAWWLPAFRNAVPASGDTSASTHEGWDLALNQWAPAPWSRVHTEGGEGLDADPADSVGRLCEDAPLPTRHCVFGADGQRLSVGFVRVVGAPSGQSPYPPDFFVHLEEGLPPALSVPSLSALASLLGLGFSPGGRVDLPEPFTPTGEPGAMTAAWRLPRFTRDGFTAMSLGGIGTFVPEVSLPQLLLGVCIELPELDDVKETCLDTRRIQPSEERLPRFVLEDVIFEDRGEGMRLTSRFPLGAPDDAGEINFSEKGLLVRLPHDVDAVTVEIGLLKDKAVRVSARREDGGEVDQDRAELDAPGTVTLRLTGGGIRILHIRASGPTAHLIRLCTETGGGRREEKLIAHILSMFGPPRPQSSAELGRLEGREPARLALPRVLGTRKDEGGQNVDEDWNGEVIGASVHDRHGCVYIRYSPKLPGPWSRFIVAPYPWFELSILRVCGIRHGALVAAAQDDQNREELQDAWNDAATGPAITRYQLLDPDSRYEVRVTARAATWVGAKPTDLPPDASALDFGAPPAGVSVVAAPQSFFFRTAPAGALPDDRVLDFAQQRLFDPRALGRYLRGFDPVAELPSHLRADPLLVWFEEEWVEDLLDRYGYSLTLVLQRTDPPPTPPSGVAPIVFPLITVSWVGLPYELRNLADQRMIDAATEAPCLEDAPKEGATALITADLEPRARYDLVVQAKRASDGALTEIGRGHFRASRYTDAGALIEATGFRLVGSNPFYPLDLLVGAAPPTDQRLNDDALLDQALSDLGLDPFTPASEPRSVVLWRQIGSSWRLVGLLLDSDEALIRGPRLTDPGPNPPRLEILEARVPGIPAFLPSKLVPVRSNQAATRVLLAATGGIAVPADGVLELSFREPAGTRIARRNLLSLPLVIAQERP
jgi:hypothetical protein